MPPYMLFISGSVRFSCGRDTVLSMTAFDRFGFDADNETVVIGSGQLWVDVVVR